jgi:8-oxo-dGTP pyrophosphatase MutT (NUDIX family)
MHHNQLEGLTRFQQNKLQQLDLLRGNLARGAYPGYPEQTQRLVASLDDFDRLEDGRLIIPDGPWTVNTHSNRQDTESQPSWQETVHLWEMGSSIDAFGRPLHPWLKDMVEDPAIGIVTGKGWYWQWGPNRADDAIAKCGNYVFLVQRADTDEIVFPGGMEEDTELPMHGAAREFGEETGIAIPAPGDGRLIYDGPITDTRATANAWPHTSAYLFEFDSMPAPKLDYSEVRDGGWVHIDTVLRDNLLIGSHQMLLNQALPYFGR